jgi:hypothetical protein
MDVEPSAGFRAASDHWVGSVKTPRGEDHDPLLKVTLRLRKGVAATLAARAQAAGLSRGDYFATVLEGMPAPPIPADHLECLTALGRSTDALAVVAKDMGALIRRASDASVSAIVDEFFGKTLVEAEVTTHLRLASQLLGELRAEAASRSQALRPIPRAPSRELK